MNIITPTIDTIIKRVESQMGMTIEEISDCYYFRGENGKFEEGFSTSTLYRVMNLKEKKNPEDFKRKMLVLGESIEEFRLKKDNLISTMVRLRHEGICTPIIDFTEDLLIALFFACIPSGEEGYIKFFSKKDFILRNYEDFNENIYHYSLLTGTTTVKPIIIKNVKGVHPNVSKQSSVLCFSFNGKAFCQKPTSIKESEKRNVIRELNKLRINTKTLFTGQESITTSILLDANEEKSVMSNNMERQDFGTNKYNTNTKETKNGCEIWHLFNGLLSEYNKNIWNRCSKDLLTFEDKLIITKNIFKPIHIQNERKRDIETIVRLLEMEHYFSHKKSNADYNLSLSLQDLETEIQKDLVVQLFNPNRILFTDKLLIVFSKLILITPGYLSEDIFEFPFTFLDDTNDNNDSMLRKRKENFGLVIDEWLLFMKKNQDFRLHLKGSDIFNVILNILDLTKRNKQEKKSLVPLLKQFSVIILLLSFHPYNRYKVLSDRWDRFFISFKENINGGNKSYFEFNKNFNYANGFQHGESYGKKNSEKDMKKVFSSIKKIQ